MSLGELPKVARVGVGVLGCDHPVQCLPVYRRDDIGWVALYSEVFRECLSLGCVDFERYEVLVDRAYDVLVWKDVAINALAWPAAWRPEVNEQQLVLASSRQSRLIDILRPSDFVGETVGAKRGGDDSKCNDSG